MINYRKVVPELFVVVGYLVIWLMLLSALGMWIALFLGRGELDLEGMRRTFGFFTHLMPFYVAPFDKPYLLLCVVGMVVWGSWLWSTRVRLSSSTLRRRIFCFLFAWVTFALWFGIFSAGYMKPISYDKIMLIDGWVKTEKYREHLNSGGLKLVGWALMLLPTSLVFSFANKIFSLYRGDTVVKEWFEAYRFEWKYLGRFGDDRANVLPDITLALHAENKTPIVLSGDSRQLGTMLIGPPGSGKTSLKIIKAFRQDLEHIQKAINAYPKYIKKHGYRTEAFNKAWGKHLIGSIVIEPAKDLCDKAYDLAMDHGFPEEFVVYLDPSNPKTPSFNSLVGPIEQVAETITAVLEGMSESSDEFFRQSCRTVLKQYIYLLKFNFMNNCTLLDLDRMYQDARYVADLVDELQKLLPSEEKLDRMDKDKRIFWTLAIRTVQWFWSDGIAPEKDRQTGLMLKYGDGVHLGKIKMVDKQFEFTRTTRNLLSDLITNPFLSRILIGDNAVDLDKLMARGGILLCNTANGELGNVSDAFGKLVLMSAQNAVFRRKGEENTRPLVSLYVDEFYDYINLPFLKLAGQGRKYKIAPLIACQTLAQFDIKFGNGFTDGMLGTIRNYVVYGGVGVYDAEKLSPLFGMHTVDEMTIQESITPETMTNAGYSYRESSTREEIELVSSDKIMFNKFKYSYVRLVSEGSTQKAIRAEGDFVDFGKADTWRRGLNGAALEVFMSDWKENIREPEHFDMNWVREDLEAPTSKNDVAVAAVISDIETKTNPIVTQPKKIEYIQSPAQTEEAKIDSDHFLEVEKQINHARARFGGVSKPTESETLKPVVVKQKEKQSAAVPIQHEMNIDIVPTVELKKIVIPEVPKVQASSFLNFGEEIKEIVERVDVAQLVKEPIDVEPEIKLIMQEVAATTDQKIKVEDLSPVKKMDKVDEVELTATPKQREVDQKRKTSNQLPGFGPLSTEDVESDFVKKLKGKLNI